MIVIKNNQLKAMKFCFWRKKVWHLYVAKILKKIRTHGSTYTSLVRVFKCIITSVMSSQYSCVSVCVSVWTDTGTGHDIYLFPFNTIQTARKYN